MARRKTKQQKQHHLPNLTSPLIRIPQFDPIRQVTLDYMHLLCNGVIKTLLERWTGKKKIRAKLGRLTRKQLSNILLSLKGSIPIEFQRKTFELDDIANWKATQYGFFLLYAGPFVLKPVLPTKYYRNFLHLSFASRILCHPTIVLTYTDVADNLLQRFFSELPDLYGENSQVIFDYPRSSSEVGLHMQTSISPSLREYSMGLIVRKCFRIIVEGSTYLVNLLHV